MKESVQTPNNLPVIGPVSPPQLSEASGKGEIDASTRRLRDLEWQSYVCQRRRFDAGDRDFAEPLTSSAPDDLTGIALSGGGIRSATFALGVLQALARHDLLRRFDYLSTVSGGGYIGTSLTWLTSKRVAESDGRALPFGLGPSDPDLGCAAPFPYGTDDPRAGPGTDGVQATGDLLRYLRQHGNYLTPGEGITLTSVIVVLVRGIVLNLLVWLPILATVMWALIWLSAPSVSEAISPWARAWLVGLGGSIALPDWPSAAQFIGALSPHPKWLYGTSPPLFAFGAMLATAITLFAGCVAAFAVYSFVTWLNHTQRRWFPDGTKYSWRRGFEKWIRVPFWTIGVLLLLGSVPFVTGRFHGWVQGSSFSLIGIASGLLAFVRTMRQPKSKAEKQASWAISSSWLASFGAAFFLYGVLLVSFAFGWWAAQASAGFAVASSILTSALVVALVTGWAVDLNLITVHRFYRDRLMEAFLPDLEPALKNQTAAAAQADEASLSSMCDPTRPVGPYHLINTNLVLINSDKRTYRIRGGDSFILSPLYCGSNATGWQSTREFSKNEITLPTAMAISGAAANPWTASGGIGVTRNPLVGMLMALMNLRLGFWVPNPRQSRKKSFRANHFAPGLKEVVGASLKDTSRICLLSDGGHFENLGLYELIRRRLRLILVCDGTADPDYAFTDLQIAIARAEVDFGARIEFVDETALQSFMPSIPAVYPQDVCLSKSAYAVATITYSDDSIGHLVYLTTTLCEGVRLRLLGYKGANPDFPDQSTADQFFDEEQFEAYRELGYVVADNFVRHDMENGRLLGNSIRRPLPPALEAAE